MVIDRKIDRYVEEVLLFLPSRCRAEAEKEITEMLKDLVRDHAGKNEPDILDARAVLAELGDPEIMAMSWLEAREDLKESGMYGKKRSGILGRRISIDEMSYRKMNKALSVLLLIFSVLAVFFVGFGIIALSTHLITTMLPIFLGCVLGLVGMAGRSVLAKQV